MARRHLEEVDWGDLGIHEGQNHGLESQENQVEGTYIEQVKQ